MWKPKIDRAAIARSESKSGNRGRSLRAIGEAGHGTRDVRAPVAVREQEARARALHQRLGLGRAQPPVEEVLGVLLARVEVRRPRARAHPGLAPGVGGHEQSHVHGREHAAGALVARQRGQRVVLAVGEEVRLAADGDRLADVVDPVGGPGHDEQERHRQGRPQGQRAVAQVLAPREHAQHDQR